MLTNKKLVELILQTGQHLSVGQHPPVLPGAVAETDYALIASVVVRIFGQGRFREVVEAA